MNLCGGASAAEEVDCFDVSRTYRSRHLRPDFSGILVTAFNPSVSQALLDGLVPILQPLQYSLKSPGLKTCILHSHFFLSIRAGTDCCRCRARSCARTVAGGLRSKQAKGRAAAISRNPNLSVQLRKMMT